MLFLSDHSHMKILNADNHCQSVPNVFQFLCLITIHLSLFKMFLPLRICGNTFRKPSGSAAP